MEEMERDEPNLVENDNFEIEDLDDIVSEDPGLSDKQEEFDTEQEEFDTEQEEFDTEQEETPYNFDQDADATLKMEGTHLQSTKSVLSSCDSANETSNNLPNFNIVLTQLDQSVTQLDESVQEIQPDEIQSDET